MHDCKADLIVGQKSAQMGFTEWALNKTFFAIDIEGKNVLYVLPNRSPDATDFSNARFNPALDLSAHLRGVFSDVNNVGHKRAGNANLYVRGSKSRAGLKSVPVQYIVLDEVDEMEQKNISLAMERVSGQPERQVLAISTPTIENYGINLLYETTTKSQFFFPCPACSKHINLEFPRNMEITGDDPNGTELRNSYYFCHLCKAKLDHDAKPDYLGKGVWVPQRESEAVGYHVNQMYSSPIKPFNLASKYLKGLSNQADEQEFYNSALGKPHATEGSRVTDTEINACFGEYLQFQGSNYTHFVTAGVDVGKHLHVEIDDWFWENYDAGDPNRDAICKVIAVFKLKNFEDLDFLMTKFGIAMCVIDLNPERKWARDFTKRWVGRAEVCEYPPGTSGRTITFRDEDNAIQVDRTAWLDLSLGRFHNKGRIFLPKDITYEYREHIKAQTRIFYHDRDGNVKAKYVKGAVDDHYGHARNYAEIAFARAIVTTGNSSVSHPWQR